MEANSEGKHIQEYLHQRPGLFVKVIAKVKDILRSPNQISEVLPIFGNHIWSTKKTVPQLATCNGGKDTDQGHTIAKVKVTEKTILTVFFAS